MVSRFSCSRPTLDDNNHMYIQRIFVEYLLLQQPNKIYFTYVSVQDLLSVITKAD